MNEGTPAIRLLALVEQLSAQVWYLHREAEAANRAAFAWQDDRSRQRQENEHLRRQIDELTHKLEARRLAEDETGAAGQGLAQNEQLRAALAQKTAESNRLQEFLRADLIEVRRERDYWKGQAEMWKHEAVELGYEEEDDDEGD